MYKVVVVGTDGSPTADRAVQAAAELARSLGSELHIVTAVRGPREGTASGTGAPLVDSGSGHALAEEAAQQISERALTAFGSDLKVVEAHAAAGSADDVILDTAAELGADLIVVGSRGMRGARRYLGSVPNSVAHGAHCAVLVVKTD
jgi:nucleotide-binding universal stress UspA family protein